MWHHSGDVIQLIHLLYMGLTMSVVLLREGGKYYRKCKLFKSFRDVSEMSIFGCHKKLTPNQIYLEKFQTPCTKIWNSFDQYAACFNFAFSSRGYKTVHTLANE